MIDMSWMDDWMRIGIVLATYAVIAAVALVALHLLLRSVRRDRKRWIEDNLYYPHPLQNGKRYPIEIVLLDLAAQENCDGEPYDAMVSAAQVIRTLKGRMR